MCNQPKAVLRKEKIFLSTGMGAKCAHRDFNIAPYNLKNVVGTNPYGKYAGKAKGAYIYYEVVSAGLIDGVEYTKGAQFGAYLGDSFTLAPFSGFEAKYDEYL